MRRPESDRISHPMKFAPPALALAPHSFGAAEPITLKLWPDGPPSPMSPESEATAKLIESYVGVTVIRFADRSGSKS
jgi:hypothetical protein